MSWNATTNYDQPEPPQDIVDELRQADLKQKKTLEGAMVQPLPGEVIGAKSLLERAAEEIEKLRRVAGLMEN